MATAKTNASGHRINGIAAREYPDWSFIPEPEPVEDFMQQQDTLFRIVSFLMSRYKHRPDALVSGGRGYICYDRADMNAMCVPDCMVAFGVDVAAIRARGGYLIWEVGKPPDVVMEMATESTKDNDLYDKRALYAELGIGEYWRLDETGGDLYGEPPVGEYLVDGEYRRYELHRGADGRVWAHSEALGLNLYWDGELRRFGIYDPVGEYDYLDPEDARRVIETQRRGLGIYDPAAGYDYLDAEDARRVIEAQRRALEYQRWQRERLAPGAQIGDMEREQE